MDQICILGCGAIGCLLAGFLEEATSKPPYCIVRRATHKDALERRGCILQGLISRNVNVKAFLPGELPGNACDAAIIAVKAYDVGIALKEAVRLSENIVIVSNGFIDIEQLQGNITNVTSIIVEYGAARISDNRIEVTGIGRLIIGGEHGKGITEAAQQLSTLLERGGAKTMLVEDITPYRWAKASVNAGLNSITSILGVRNGFILENEWARRLAVQASIEVAKVARASNITLPFDPVEYLLRIADLTRGNKSSMLQDIEAGRRTEVEEIIGYVVKKGEEIGVETPLLKNLYMLIKSLEEIGGRICLMGEK